LHADSFAAAHSWLTFARDFPITRPGGWQFEMGESQIARVIHDQLDWRAELRRGQASDQSGLIPSNPLKNSPSG